MTFGEMISFFNVQVSPELIGLFGEHPIFTNPFWLMMGLSVLLALSVLALGFIFDFITDTWKLPFALFVDLMNYASFGYPYLDYVAAGCSAFIFIAISGGKFWRVPFTIISVFVTVASAPAIFGTTTLGMVSNFIPINIILMFISTIID